MISGDGNGSCTCSRVCGLISRSLLPYAVALITPPLSDGLSSTSTGDGAGGRHSFPLTKCTERDLIISLTLVFREIQKWTAEIDRNSEQEDDGKRVVEGVGKGKLEVDVDSRVWHPEPPFDGLSCTANIVVLMVAFLSVESRYVQHMAGKIIVVISSFLAKSGRKLEEFLRLLWISLDVAMHSCTLLPASAKTIPSKENLMLHYPFVKNETSAAAEESNHDVAFFNALIQPRLTYSDGTILTSLIQVLRKIMKSLKHEHGDLAESFMQLAISFLLKMPWDLLSDVQFSQTAGMHVSSIWDDSPGGKLAPANLNDVLLGALLQLFCSLVEKNDEEVGDHSLNEPSVYSKFMDLIPNILHCCFSHHDRCKNTCISRYLEHKALALMIRLSFWAQWQCSSLISWLQLLRKYFEDLLYQSIFECDAGRNISLEGSPFLASITDRRDSVFCTLHLRRRAIFIFLKCCFTLVCPGNEPCQGCACGKRSCSSTCKLQMYETSCRARALSELSEWLHRHVSLEKSADDVDYSKSCSRFASSFLQLFMDEDDLLFKMLLQLLDVPFPTLQEQDSESDRFSEEMDKDIMFHISNIFNPIHLFHLFLSSIDYDYLVLLDYIISYDTGIQCLQYLLRCLRMVCQSWPAFMESSVLKEFEVNTRHSKKSKCSEDVHVLSGKVEILSSVREEINDSTVLKKGNRTRCMYNVPKPTQQTFENARQCLLSLKSSVEDLHRKNLFPYNPTALLRSFTRFQELCEQPYRRTELGSCHS